MALDPTTPRSRRALLSAAVAATAVTVVEAVARPLPVSAVDGDDTKTIHVGDNYTDARTTTGLANTTNNLIVMTLTTTDGYALYAQASGSGKAVFGYSSNGTGVEGVCNTGVGVLGNSASGGKGVYGIANTGTGVYGVSSSSIGVQGVSKSGYAVRGNGETGAGVYGNATSGAGVIGDATTGTGVAASSSSGTALAVAGKAHFSRSGTATVTAGHKSVTVTVPGGLTGTPLCFANLRSYRSGIGVAAVRSNYPSAGKIRIYLTRVVSSATSVAWMVMD